MVKQTVTGSVDMKRLERAFRADEIFIGFPAGAEHVSEGKTKRAAPKTAIENYVLARALHFGTAKIPPRPFLYQGLQAGRVAINKAMKFALKKMVERGYAPVMDPVGSAAIGEVQAFVRGDYYRTHVPNADATKARKDGDTPLIDTANMIQALTYILRLRQGKVAHKEAKA